MDTEDKLVISQLKGIYKSLYTECKADKRDVSINTLCAHGTNGMAFLFALLVNKQLLASNERSEIGIPTVTGEAKFVSHNQSRTYHNEWNNFVSSITLHSTAPCTDIVQSYAIDSAHKFSENYAIVEQELHEILKRKGLDNLFEKINKSKLQEIYNTLSSIDVTILGDGYGLAPHRRIPGENNYEKINILVVVVADEYQEFIQEVLEITEKQDVFVMTKKEFQKFIYHRTEQNNKVQRFASAFEDQFGNSDIKNIPIDDNLQKYIKLYGYDNCIEFRKKFGSMNLLKYCDNAFDPRRSSNFSEDFISVFQEKIACNFYADYESFNIKKVKQYKNGENIIEKEVLITYFKASSESSLKLAELNDDWQEHRSQNDVNASTLFQEELDGAINPIDDFNSELLGN